MQVLLLDVPSSPRLLRRVFNAFNRIEAVVIVNVRDAPWLLRAHAAFGSSYDRSVRIIDADSQNASSLLKCLSDSELEVDVVVFPESGETMSPSVFEELIRHRTGLGHTLVAACPNDSLRHLAAIVEVARKYDVPFVHVPGVHAPYVAEYTIAQLMFYFRGLSRFYRRRNLSGRRSHRFACELTHSLAGRTLGVVGGAGKDGAATIAQAVKLGMKVRAIGSGSEHGDAKIITLGAVVDKTLDELVSRVDALSLNCRNSPQNRGVLGAGQFGRMRKGLVLINPSGAELIDPDALLVEMRRPIGVRRVRAVIMDMEYNVALDGRHADVNQALKECGVVFTPRSAGYCFEARVAAFDELSRSLDLLRREGRKSLRMAKAREVILNDGEGVPDRWVLLSDCLAATEIAARRAQDCRRRGLEILYKADGSPVTDADICAEEAIRGFLKARQHRFRFHGEDSDVHEDDQGPWEVVVDGIDGTRNFRDGNYGWCVTIACRQRETTECAIIFDPVSRTTYYAVCGEGAYIRDDDGVRRCTTPSTIPADFSFSLGSFQVSKRNDWKEHVRGRIKAIGGREREWGSVALAICAVARGGLGVFIQIGAHLHDIIAASAVAQEAGASVWLQNSLTTGRGDIIVAHRSLIDAAKAALYATVE